jgi:hypothetical protein
VPDGHAACAMTRQSEARAERRRYSTGRSNGTAMRRGLPTEQQSDGSESAPGEPMRSVDLERFPRAAKPLIIKDLAPVGSTNALE